MYRLPIVPKSPNILLYYAAAIVAGLLCGSGAAAIKDLTDTKVGSLEELERVTGAPLLGLIPEMERVRNLSWPHSRARVLESKRTATNDQDTKIATLSYIDSPFAESLRTLRTSLMLSRSSNPPQILLVTSSNAGEGKSTVSLNLAVVLAQQGARVLLVDVDLRRPVLHQRMGLDASDGLSAALSNDQIAPRPQQIEQMPNLYVVCGGPAPPFPAELLGSGRMHALFTQWRREYDFIVLDGPPVLPVTDAIVLEQQCDAVLLVARHGVTEKKAIHRSYRTVARQLPPHVALGMVLNAVPGRSSDFYEYYGYRSRIYAAEGLNHEARA